MNHVLVNKHTFICVITTTFFLVHAMCRRVGICMRVLPQTVFALITYAFRLIYRFGGSVSKLPLAPTHLITDPHHTVSTHIWCFECKCIRLKIYGKNRIRLEDFPPKCTSLQISALILYDLAIWFKVSHLYMYTSN